MSYFRNRSLVLCISAFIFGILASKLTALINPAKLLQTRSIFHSDDFHTGSGVTLEEIKAIAKLAQNCEENKQWVQAGILWKKGAELGDRNCMNNYAVNQLMHIALPATEEAEIWAIKANNANVAGANILAALATRAKKAIFEPL